MVVARVYEEIEDGIERLFPEQLGMPRSKVSLAATASSQAELPSNFELEACAVHSIEDGYLQLVDAEALMELASEEDLLLLLECRPGHYIVKGQAIVTVWPGSRVNESLETKLNTAFVLGNRRTSIQDIEFSLQQLVEIAVRALSPGINDPFTAFVCVDRLGSSLCSLAGRDIPSTHRFDPQGQLRVVVPGATFAGIVDTAFNQIRQNARSNPAVAIRMLDAITQIADNVQRSPDAASLQRQADMIVKGARKAVQDVDDLLDVEKRFTKTTQALNKLSDLK